MVERFEYLILFAVKYFVCVLELRVAKNVKRIILLDFRDGILYLETKEVTVKYAVDYLTFNRIVYMTQQIQIL